MKELISFNDQGEEIKGLLFLPDKQERYPLVIICHGALENRENYYLLASYLQARGIAALALDMYGHGESGGERYNVIVDKWVSNIRGAIAAVRDKEYIDLNRIGAFGLSSGGTAVLEAARVESSLKALVVSGATVKNSLSLVETILFNLLSLLGYIKKQITGNDLRVNLYSLFKDLQLTVDTGVDQLLKNDPVLLNGIKGFPFPGGRECFIVDILENVSEISIPTLVIHGHEDQLEAVESSRLLYQNLNCMKELKIIDGSGHLIQLDANKEVMMEYTCQWMNENL